MPLSTEQMADTDLSQAYIYSNGVKVRMSSLATGGGTASAQIDGPFPSKQHKVPFNWSRWMNQSLSNGSTAIGGTSRVAFQAPFGMHDIVVDYYNLWEAGGEEPGFQTFPLIIKAVFEYPANTFYYMTFSGIGSPLPNFPGATISPLGKLTSDPIGVSVPAGAVCWVRTYLQMPRTPTFAAPTTSTTGGMLAAATYKYNVTALYGTGLVESAPAGAQSITTTGSTSSNTLVITSPLAPDAGGMPQGFNIYRTTASSPQYFTTIPASAGTTTWVDTGLTTEVAIPANSYAYSATTNATYPLGPCAMGVTSTAVGAPLPPVSGNNYVEWSGNGSNQLLTTGTSWMSSTSQSGNNAMYGPCDIRGTPDAGLDVPVVITMGDSISTGTGDIYDRGFIQGTFVSNGIAYYQKGHAGEYGTQWSAPYAFLLIQYMQAVSDVIDQIDTNDINVFGNQVSSVQAYAINRWLEVRRRGAAGSQYPRIRRMTLLPRVVTSDSLTSYANQEPGGIGISAATNATPIVCTANGTYLGNIGSPPVTTVPSGASSSATSFVVTSGNGIVANQAFQVSGATYVVTSTSGTTINFTPALAANVSANATIAFGTTATAAAAVGATSVTVGYTGAAQNANISNTSWNVNQGQIFFVNSVQYYVTAVNYLTNTVTFSPALQSAIASGTYMQFVNYVTIRNGLGNTAVNGTFYVACSSNTMSLYTDYLFQSPVAGTGTYTANSALAERPVTEANRQTYNAWVRAGCPLLISGTPSQLSQWAGTYTAVAPGTAGAVIAGQSNHPVNSIIDIAAVVETNAAGQNIAGSSYWPVGPSSFYYTLEGTHPTQNSYPLLSATLPISSIVNP